MRPSLKARYLYGAGAAACAACCAAPLLTLLGIAGAAAKITTFVFAGVVFGLVVAAGTALAYGTQRRRRRGESCTPKSVAPVDLAIPTTRSKSD